MRKRLLITALLLTVIAAGVWFAVDLQPPKPMSPAGDTGVTVGRQAPRFTLADLAGTPTGVWQPGKVTVLNFWASWCPPCREEMPELQRFAASQAQDVAFYGVNIQEPAAKIVGYLEQNKYILPVLMDSDGTVSSVYRITSIPTTIVIDKTGIIRYRKAGAVTEKELQAVIKAF